MEFSEDSKLCALKFLEEFTSSEVLPDAGEQLPIRSNWPQLDPGEVEAECLDMARRYLSEKSVLPHYPMLIIIGVVSP